MKKTPRRAPAQELPDGLVALTWLDLVGVARTRAIPARHLASKGEYGLSFPACGQAMSMFGTIIDNPFGTLGDVRQVPIMSTRIALAQTDPIRSGLQMVLSESIGPDGAAWPLCTRTLLRQTVDKFAIDHKIRVVATFEHEFKLYPAAGKGTPPLSMTLEALRHASPLGETIEAALAQAGIQMEAFEPEFAPYQYEISTAPKDAVRAADEAVLVREIVRDTARGQNVNATFVPKTEPETGSSGLHIHLSLWDSRGRPLLFDSKARDGLSSVGQHFIAGILEHARGLLPFVAPGVISYLRLGPGTWSSGYAAYGTANREAMLRLCSVPSADPVKRARSFNIEFRSADGLCNPYLALATILLAGLHGLTDRLKAPPPLNVDPAKVSHRKKDSYASLRLPTSLTEALSILEADASLCSWLPPDLLNLFLALRRNELAILGELSPADACARYRAVY